MYRADALQTPEYADAGRVWRAENAGESPLAVRDHGVNYLQGTGLASSLPSKDFVLWDVGAFRA